MGFGGIFLRPAGAADWENEKLGPCRARFLAVRKQDKKAKASFGTRGGRGCNCRVRRIVVRCYKNKWRGSGFSYNNKWWGVGILVAIWSL